MKNKIRLNESVLTNIIRESIKRTLSETTNGYKYEAGYKNFKGNKGHFLDVDTDYSSGGKVTGDFSKHENGQRSSEGYKLRGRNWNELKRKAKQIGAELPSKKTIKEDTNLTPYKKELFDVIDGGIINTDELLEQLVNFLSDDICRRFLTEYGYIGI